jgi:hypothetical protein
MKLRVVRDRSVGLALLGVAVGVFGQVACSSEYVSAASDAGSEAAVDGAVTPVDSGLPEPKDAASMDSAVATDAGDAGTTDASDAATTDASDSGVPARGFRYLYTVKPATRGAITSIAMADAACFAARPSGVTAVKALLVGTTRTACTSANCATGGAAEHLDWPLAPSTEYRRADGTTIIAKTNAMGLFDALTSSIGLVEDFVWTGLSPNGMGTGTNWTTSSSTCMNWASTSAAQNGVAAYAGPNFKNVPFGHFLDTCDKNFVFYCAESN